MECDYKKVVKAKRLKKDYYANIPHITCTAGQDSSIMNTIYSCIKKGKAAKRLLQHLKIIEYLNNQPSSAQIYRTIRMHGYGRRFQVNIALVKPQGLLNPNLIITVPKGKFTIRNLMIMMNLKKINQ